PLTRLDDCEALFRETKQNFQHFLNARDVLGDVNASLSAEKVTTSLFNAMTHMDMSQKVLSVVLNIQTTVFYLSFVLDKKHFRLPPTRKVLSEYLTSSMLLVAPLLIKSGEMCILGQSLRKPPKWSVFHVAQGHSIRDSIAQAFESIDEIALSWAKDWFTKPLAVPQSGFSAHIESEDEEEEETNQPSPTPATRHYVPLHQILPSMVLGLQNPPEFARAVGGDANSGGGGPRGETIQQGGANGGVGRAMTVFGEKSGTGGTVPLNSEVQCHPKSASPASRDSNTVNPGGDGPHAVTAQQGGVDGSGDGAAGVSVQNPPRFTSAAGEDTNTANSGGDGPCGETLQQGGVNGGGGRATTDFGEKSGTGGTVLLNSEVQHHPESASSASGDTNTVNPGGDGLHPETAQQGGADGSGDGAATKPASDTLPHSNAENEPQQSAGTTTNAADGDTDVHNAEGSGTRLEASQQDGADSGGDGDSTKLVDEIQPPQNAEDEHQQSPAASANAAGGGIGHPNIEADGPQPDSSQHGTAVGGGDSAAAQPTDEAPSHNTAEDGPQQSSNVSANAQGGETETPNAEGNTPRLILPVYNSGSQPVGSVASGDNTEGQPATTNTPAPGHQSRDNVAEERTQGTGQDGLSSGGNGDSEPQPKPKPKNKQKAGYEQDGVLFKKVLSKLFKQVVVIDLEADCDLISKKIFAVHNSIQMTDPNYNPRFHQKYEVTYVERLLEVSTNAPEGDMAESCPPSPVFEEFGHLDYCAMTSRGIAAMFTMKNIVITGVRDVKPPFDRTRLSFVGPLDHTIVVLGKAISTDDLPLLADSFVRDVFPSDIFEWSHVVGDEYFPRQDSMPTMELRWGTVSMGDTSQDFRIAPNGFATVMKVHSGRKLIIVAQPRSMQAVVDRSAGINIYTGNIRNRVLNRKLFNLQSLVLEPDDTVLLCPNTLYFSVDIDPTICEFFYEKYLTKPPNSSTVTEHLPILTSFEGVLDMMVLCNLFELSDLFWAFTNMFKTSATTKENKTKSMSVLDTYCIVHLRAIAHHLIKWIFFNYTFWFVDNEDSDSEMSMDRNSDDGDEDMTGEEALATIYQPFLLHQGRALVEYVSSAAAQREGEDVKEDIFADMCIKPTSFKSAMELHFKAMNIQDNYSESPLDERTLSWMGNKFTVHWQAEYIDVDLSVDGLTATDAVYGLDLESFPSFHEKQLLSDDKEMEKSPRKRQRRNKKQK
ncbi:hypothetical protein DXG01_000916, partial [Tephrocybe rancida]